MEEKDQEKKTDSVIDKALDFFLGNNTKKYLIGILVVGFIIRVIIAGNVSVIADEMIHGNHAMNIISAGVINVQNETPAWLYMTDIAYKIFGISGFSARFLSILFGSLTILVVYLLGKELLNDRVGLIAAFFLAVSPYHIRYTLMEMDVAMIFFILFSFYFFAKGLKDKKISYLAVVLSAIAILIKPITLLFIIAFCGYFIIVSYKEKEKRNEFLQKNKNRLLISLILLFLFSTPILAYNYILYEQKGITDVIFSRFLGINQQIYAQLQGYNKSFVFSEVFTSGLRAFVSSFWRRDPIVFIFGIFGILLIFAKKEYSSMRKLVLFHIPAWIFLLGTSILETHLSAFVPLFTLMSGSFFYWSTEKYSLKLNKKKIICLSLLIILIINLYFLLPYLSSKAAIFKMRQYASNNVGPNDIVIVDSRVYRGRIAWMFNDKAYLEASYFPQFLALNENYSTRPLKAEIYFVECVPDDCGWGTIKDQPEFNASMEEIVSFFKNNTSKEKDILGGGGYEEKTGETTFRIYKANIDVNSEVYSLIYSTHDWFYYPVRWAKDDWYDKYTPKGFFQETFNSVGKIFLWIAVILGYFFAFFIFYEVFKKVSYPEIRLP